MSKFRWKTWAGDTETIEADRIEFAPGHVIFRDLNHRIILAMENSNVNHLVQLRPEEDV